MWLQTLSQLCEFSQIQVDCSWLPANGKLDTLSTACKLWRVGSCTPQLSESLLSNTALLEDNYNSISRTHRQLYTKIIHDSLAVEHAFGYLMPLDGSDDSNVTMLA